jgi:hypothetical protein
VRQARYVGRSKTLCQLLLAATVANLTLLANSATTGAPTATGVALVMLASATCAALGLTCASIGPVGHSPFRHHDAATRLAASFQPAGFRPDF